MITPENGYIMVDSIIEYVRIEKTGVSSVELAERFLKFKKPPVKFAEAAISGIIAGDKRCVLNPDGLWVFDESRGDAEITFDKLPLCIVYMLADSQGDTLNYIAVWDLFPYPQFCCDVWLHKPLSAVAGVDPSGIDLTADSIETRLVQVVSILSEKIPVLFSYDDTYRFNAQFENDVLTDKNRILLFDDLLHALSIDIPDNGSLSHISGISGNTHVPDSPPEQAKQFASIVSDALKMLKEKNINTRNELDHAVMLTTEKIIAGKHFSLQEINSLPQAPGVYGLKDYTGKYLFISKCKDLHQSITSHFRKFSDSSKKRIAVETVSFDAHRCGSELECELFEHRLIHKHNPSIRRNTTRKVSEIPEKCILFLPHTQRSMVLTIWVSAKRNVVMKAFSCVAEPSAVIDAELNNYFYTQPDSDPSDPFERELIGNFLERNPDFHPLIIPSSLNASDLIHEFKERIKKFTEN